jgi:hypothetical protein
LQKLLLKNLKQSAGKPTTYWQPTPPDTVDTQSPPSPQSIATPPLKL